jgi:hypothetical protein
MKEDQNDSRNTRDARSTVRGVLPETEVRPLPVMSIWQELRHRRDWW